MPDLAGYTLFLDVEGRDWVLKRDGALRALRRFPSKGQAIDFLPERFGTRYPASVKIQKQDGTFEDERTYPRSMDPRKSKG
jgi:hypothetical protein